MNKYSPSCFLKKRPVLERKRKKEDLGRKAEWRKKEKGGIRSAPRQPPRVPAASAYIPRIMKMTERGVEREVVVFLLRRYSHPPTPHPTGPALFTEYTSI